MQTIVQHPSDLTLVLYDTLPDIPLQVIQQQPVTLPHGWRVTFNVITESHAVMLSHRDRVVFSEVLTCQPIGRTSALYRQLFNTLHAMTYTTPHHQVRVRFEVERDADYFMQDVAALEVAFPRVHGQRPLTRVQWAQRGDVLCWQTCHTYPQANGQTIYVYSTSHFQLA